MTNLTQSKFDMQPHRKKRIAKAIHAITEMFGYLTIHHNGRIRTLPNSKKLPERIAQLCANGADLSLWTSHETCWLCIESRERETTREVVTYLRGHGFKSPITLQTQNSIALLYRFPWHLRSIVANGFARLTRLLHLRFPEVQTHEELTVSNQWTVYSKYGETFLDTISITDVIRHPKQVNCNYPRLVKTAIDDLVNVLNQTAKEQDSKYVRHRFNDRGCMTVEFGVAE